MALVYIMAAKDSVTGDMYAWSSGIPDFAGGGYPGPNDPTEVQQRAVGGSPVASGGGGEGTTGANLTNSNQTLTIAQGNNRTMLLGTQTADRTDRLSRTGAIAGESWIRIINDGATYDISVLDDGDGLSVGSVGPGESKRFAFDGAVWGYTA